MTRNKGRILGLYDELSSFLAQVNIYRGRAIIDSHDLGQFLSLYNGKTWSRETGMVIVITIGAVVIIIYLVTRDANFLMERTALTVGGLTQPTVARSLIELLSCVEKGLTQRFLWIFPKPLCSPFENLEQLMTTFVNILVS